MSWRRLGQPFLAIAIAAALFPLASPVAEAQEEDSFSFYAPDDLGLNFSLPGALPTAVDWGPDDRLYVADFRGRIYVYNVTRSAPGKYSATPVMGTPVLAVNQIPNHNDNGAAVGNAHRLVTGMLVGGTASNPVVYVTSSDPRAFGTDKVNADTNSGVLSRLTWTGSSWQHQKVVQGLPRSKENHGPNGMELSADGNTLYLAQGGLTNQGARSEAFHNLPEYAYSAAILSVDLTHPTIAGGGTCNLPKLGGGTSPCSNPAPWGGNDGATMVKWVSNSPVQVFAPGFRNAYDIVRTEKGHLFSIDNGANSNFGGKPLPDSTAGTCKDTPNSDSPSVSDHLHLVTQGFYGGHPNPTRANPAGNGFSGAVPVANPAECKTLLPGSDGSLATFALSTNGITEYTSNKFGGKLKGDLFTVMFGSGPGGNNIVRVDLNTAGTGVVKTQNLMGSGGNAPLSIVALGDDTPFPGVIFVANFNNFQSPPTVVALEPQDDFVCSPLAGSYSNDADGDGYSDQDEIDNGTDPCNAASVPPDLSGNGISDLNDPDDDADGIPDEDDAFARDPQNGTTTNIPVRFDWRPGDNHGGILGLGFTGLMINNHTNYLDQYDPDNMTTFSAATTGLLTIDAVPPGDALGSLNTQQYGFQFGFNVPTATFSANTRIFAPFAGTTPQGHQSMGLQIGTGHQDNYVKVVLNANDGQSRVEMLSEINGTPLIRGTANLALPGPDYVDLWITINPTTSTARASYSIEGGPRTAFGNEIQIPTNWLTKPLAAGIISTSRSAQPMSATWEHFQVKTDTTAPDPDPPPPGGEVLYRVNAGGPQLAGSPVWTIDSNKSPSPYSNWDTASSKTTSYSGASVSMDDPSIPEGTPVGLFRTERYDTGPAIPMRWAFPVDSGDYLVRLYFSEMWSGAQKVGGRVFDVVVEEDKVFAALDVFAEVGANAGLVKSTTTTVTDGTLDIEFLQIVQNPAVKAIEILTAGDTTPPPDPDPVVPTVGVSPSSLDFGTVTVGDTATANVTVTNNGSTGDQSVTISGATITGTNASQFAVNATTSTNLAPGQSTTIGVNYQPATTGNHTATLNISHTGSNPTPITVALTGNATTTAPDPDPPGEPVWKEIAPAGAAVVQRHENGFVGVGNQLFLVGGRRTKPLQRFDTATGQWSNTGVQTTHFHHFQPVVVNGLVYIVGAMEGTCCTETEAPLPNVKVFNPANNTLVDGHEIPADRRRGAAGAVHHNGWIYLAGGILHGHGQADTNVLWFDRYNPSTGEWQQLPDIPRKRDHFQAAVVGSKLYLVGGRRTESSNFFGPAAQVAQVDVYDFTTGKWLSSPTNLPTPRAAAMTAAVDGAIYVIGGEGSGKAYDRVDRLNTATMTWDTLPPIPIPRHGTGAAVCEGDIYIAAGSKNQGGALDDETNMFHALDIQGNGLTCLP